MARLRMAVIGVGHLGKEHARILAGLPQVELVGVVDVNLDQAQAVARRCRTQAFDTYWPLLKRVDAATIVVPTSQHFPVADDFLRHGVALLVEKPLALNLEQAEQLTETARQQGVALQVGHIERFNPAFEELQRRPLQPKFVMCERIGPFTGRSTDIGVVLDLMIHDLDLLLALVQAPVEVVEALGVSVFGGNEDIAHARLVFANGCVATLAASRASPVPLRRMQVWGPEGYAHLDFAGRRLSMMQPSDDLRRAGLDPARLDPAARLRLKEDVFGHYLQLMEVACPNATDQLTCELQHFVHCVQSGTTPRVSGQDGRAVMALATRILQSLRSHRWEGHADGAIGPTNLPTPCGTLFQSARDEKAAA